MDKMTIIGLVAILMTIVYVLAEGNILHMLFNPLALIIVYGGTFSATLIAYPWAEMGSSATIKSALNTVSSARQISLTRRNTGRARSRCALASSNTALVTLAS